MSAERVNPPWYDAPTNPDAKKVYDDKVAAFLVDAQTRPQKEEISRADNAIALEKLRAENAENQRKSHLESEDKQFTGVLDSLRTTAVGAIDRSRDTAKYVQTASVAAAGLYTGLVSLVFGIADTARDLPLRGAIPTLFFGLAVAFSTWYLAFVPDGSGSLDWPTPSSLPRQNAKLHLDYLIIWINKVVTARAWALRASSLYLLLAVAFLPAAFIDPPKIPNVSGIVASTPAPNPTIAPAPTPLATLAWPSPPAIQQPRLALELYRRQLDAFEKSQAEGPQSPSVGWDWFLIAIATAAGIVAFVSARRGSRAGGASDQGPDLGDSGGDGMAVISLGGPRFP